MGHKSVNIYTHKEQAEYRFASQHLGIILAKELKDLNHEEFDRTSNRDNNHYKKIYNHLLFWQKSNEEIQSLHTLKKDKKGKYYFLIAPETDYNKNGVISGNQEKSIPIGTTYHQDIQELNKAFSGLFRTICIVLPVSLAIARKAFVCFSSKVKRHSSPSKRCITGLNIVSFF